ncbi:DUF6807 family protein [Actinoplanes sp. NPDC048796]|uniref:DUF6807 family protein n=1 Tax=unclassified Actinoplanes TaxID=2626549 RepID=UPI0033CC729D
MNLYDYVTEPDLDIRLGPRPYLHPVRTLAGTVVTDALPFDHPWHLGASLTMADVNGWNLWGGRTFVDGEGYVWREDHGRIRHLTPEDLVWEDGEGRTLLTERRRIAATASADGWELSFSYALTAPHEVTLGSPATNGRTGGAGYGGFFWRCPPGQAVASAENGSADPALTLTTDSYRLTFTGLRDADRWFLRTDDYIGVCAALAYTDPLVIPAGETIHRDIRVRIEDVH